MPDVKIINLDSKNKNIIVLFYLFYIYFQSKLK